jgi:hypothetical protein
MNKSRAITVGSAVAVLALTAGTASAATSMITSKDIQNGAVHHADLTPGINRTLSMAGSLRGAVYRVENYENGGGGDATVACANTEENSQKYIAISGGVEAGHTGTNDFSVTASFPGRMDWDTGEPKADRLDGWIVLGNGQYTDNLKVWALCIPKTNIPVRTVNLDN